MQDLLSWALGVHGVILTLALAGLYRYGDRGNMFKITLGDTDEMLGRIRLKIAIALEEELVPVFQRGQSAPRIVSPDGYSERPIDPVRSDAFREAVHRFIHSETNALVEYRQVYRARNQLCFWARILSWAVLGLSLWEAVCLAVLGIFGKVYSVQMPEAAIGGSLVPTTAMALAFFCCQAGLFRQHDVINDHKARNPKL